MINLDDTYAGAYLHPSGTKVLIHLAEDLTGNRGWYWCENVQMYWDEIVQDYVYTSGRSGVGPFSSAHQAAFDAGVSSKQPAVLS